MLTLLTRWNKKFIFLVVILLTFIVPLQSKAVPISITKQSDLAFGKSAQNSTSKTVPPDTTETATNASFQVSGDPNTAYSIILPSDGTVNMTTGAGGANETIAINSFQSNPSGANGLLDGAGIQMLYVGATRATIPGTQVAGSYSGTFTITVSY